MGHGVRGKEWLQSTVASLLDFSFACPSLPNQPSGRLLLVSFIRLVSSRLDWTRLCEGLSISRLYDLFSCFSLPLVLCRTGAYGRPPLQHRFFSPLLASQVSSSCPLAKGRVLEIGSRLAQLPTYSPCVSPYSSFSWPLLERERLETEANKETTKKKAANLPSSCCNSTQGQNRTMSSD